MCVCVMTYGVVTPFEVCLDLNLDSFGWIDCMEDSLTFHSLCVGESCFHVVVMSSLGINNLFKNNVDCLLSIPSFGSSRLHGSSS
jgi:hypothetical protein